MIKVWKLPDGINIDNVKLLKGNDGNFLNPIQDIDNNWILSEEEYDCNEFQYLKIEYKSIYEQMILIDYSPLKAELAK